jgi:hypothetical protein
MNGYGMLLVTRKQENFYRKPPATKTFCSIRLAALPRAKQNIFTLKMCFPSVTTIRGNTSLLVVFPSARQTLYDNDDVEDKLQKSAIAPETHNLPFPLL